MLEGFRRNIGERLLKKEITTNARVVVAKNFNNIQKLGIVFNVEDENSFKIVKKLIQLYREEGIKKVKALGYYDGKVSPHYLLPSLDFDFINRKDLTWYYKPEGVAVENFTTDNFDVLIDMVDVDCFPMKYLVASAVAKLKIGKYSDSKQEFYDLMIDVAQNNQVDYFIDQVNYYLNMLNRTE